MLLLSEHPVPWSKENKIFGFDRMYSNCRFFVILKLRTANEFLSTFKIKGLERWLQLVDDLQPYMDEYGYKMFFASTNDDETVIFDLNETDDQEKAMKMLNLSEVINMRKETGIDLESQETLSVISKHKVW